MATVQQVGYRRRPSRAVYRRRRVAALLVLMVTVVGVLTLLAPNSGATPAHQPDPVLVVVGPGDTVLELVRPHVPAGQDPRAYAADVLRESGLDARAVRPGAVLRLPRS